MSKGKVKRVNITESNWEIVARLAEVNNLHINDYLDYLMNRAILEESNKTKQPLYVWKSR